MASRGVMALEELVPRIRAAFPLAPVPGEPLIETHDDENIIPTFLGRPWTAFTARELRAQSAALSFFTPGAFVYYLPAFMMATVEARETADIIPDVLLAKFGRPDAQRLVSLLTEQQRWVVLDFFSAYVADDPCLLRPLAEAMDHLGPGWRPSTALHRVTVLAAGLTAFQAVTGREIQGLIDQIAVVQHAAQSEVESRGGTVLRFAGDALVAGWPDQPREAADAALAISRRARELSRESDWTSSQSFEAAIGIADAIYTESREGAILKATTAASSVQAACQAAGGGIWLSFPVASRLSRQYAVKELDSTGRDGLFVLAVDR